jgi:hypothetical protein
MTSADHKNSVLQQHSAKKIDDESQLTKAEIPIQNMPGVYIADWRKEKDDTKDNKHKQSNVNQSKQSQPNTQQSIVNINSSIVNSDEHDTTDCDLNEFESIADQIHHRRAKEQKEAQLAQSNLQDAQAAAFTDADSNNSKDKNITSLQYHE